MSYSIEADSTKIFKWWQFLSEPNIVKCPTTAAGRIFSTHRGATIRFYDPTTTYIALPVVDHTMVLKKLIRSVRRQHVKQKLLPSVDFREMLENEQAAMEMFSTIVWEESGTALNSLIINRLENIYKDSPKPLRHTQIAQIMKMANYRVDRRTEVTLGDSADEYRIDIMTTLEPFFEGTALPESNPDWLSPARFCETISELATNILGGKPDGQINNRFKNTDQKKFPRMVLNVIELKKPGTIDTSAWDVAASRVGERVKRHETALRNVRIMSAQIAKYSELTNCPYFILSDFNNNVLTKVSCPAINRIGERRLRYRSGTTCREIWYQPNHSLDGHSDPRAMLFFSACQCFRDMNEELWEAVCK
ncbi:hypothetical protein CPB85DRAFT_245927 [Mucidula mucida]|nr:hypothetical protein CPB85DRAFT_245927 [Mucidula mucida]